jgi:hypothetical protein
LNKENVGVKNSKANSDYKYTQHRKNYFKKQRSLGEEHKDIIFHIIALSEPDGKSTNELTKDTGFHRDTIYTLCKQMLKNGLLIKSGKFGKYHLGPKSLEDSGLHGFIFGTEVTKQFYSLRDFICTTNKFCNNEYCKSVLEGRPYKEIIPDKDLYDEVHLFEFAIRIGAIISYELIESMKYAQLPNLNYVKRNDLILKWIDNVIRPLLLIQIFRRLYPVSKRLRRISNTGKQKDERLSFFEIDKEKFIEIERTFKSTFPHLFEDLEKIRGSISAEVDRRLHYVNKVSDKK